MRSPMIEQEAYHRLRDYRATISKSQHSALQSVPCHLAYLLHRNPAYVAPAVEAFYLRDPIAVKPLATKDTATLLFAPEDFVTMSVRFPKVGYEQLISQESPPPPAWCVNREINMLFEDVEEEDDTLPADEEIKSWPQNEDDDKWLEIDFMDFDKELKGCSKGTAAGDMPEDQGFGDETTQKDLKDMISRFGKFLNEDEETGAETFSCGSTAFGPDDEDEDDEGEAASFTDTKSEQAMREMIGMSDTGKETNYEEEMERDDEKEAEQIWKMMQEVYESRKNGTNEKSKDKAKDLKTKSAKTLKSVTVETLQFFLFRLLAAHHILKHPHYSLSNTPSRAMARLIDLPPEVRLKIYRLLLADPIRDGLRVILTFDLLDNKTTWGRTRCAQTEQPHREGHSAEPCCVDVSPSILHHLDFTDLWSLARASKMVYVEATQITYNNADLVYSLGDLISRVSTPGHIAAFVPFNCYFEQYSPTKMAMLHSLVIQDKFETMSARDMKSVVDIVNSCLPNLRVFGYYI
ncbi:SGT1-domain-containing protein, partial [Aureobasidium melanogenum]